MYVDFVSCVPDKKLLAVAASLGYDTLVHDIPFVIGTTSQIIRQTVEQKKRVVLLDPHRAATRHLLHQRDSGLNHVICHFARQNEIIVAFSLGYLKTPYQLGAVQQNIRLCEKYRVPLALVSFASDMYGLRSVHDMQALGRVLGMNTLAARRCVSVLSTLIE